MTAAWRRGARTQRRRWSAAPRSSAASAQAPTPGRRGRVSRGDHLRVCRAAPAVDEAGTPRRRVRGAACASAYGVFRRRRPPATSRAVSDFLAPFVSASPLFQLAARGDLAFACGSRSLLRLRLVGQRHSATSESDATRRRLRVEDGRAAADVAFQVPVQFGGCTSRRRAASFLGQRRVDGVVGIALMMSHSASTCPSAS